MNKNHNGAKNIVKIPTSAHALNTIKTFISGSFFKIYTMFKTVVAYSSTYEFRNCSSDQKVLKDLTS